MPTPNQRYHKSEGISRSQLFYISKSPELFKYMLDNPLEPTKDLVIGSAFHKLVLEPDEFESEFLITPEVDLRTREWKAVYAEFTSKLTEGVTPISQQDYDLISAMRDSVMRNELARTILQGTVEQPVYWNDPITGELCKCKPDSLTEIGESRVVVDLKSCRDADEDAFMRACFKYGYDLQVGMYKTGCDIVRGGNHEFVFVCVEKTPPYSVNVLQADDFFIEHGQRLYRRYMDIYHECKTTGNWYGYGGKQNVINVLSVPSWMMTEV